jgi:hypothetical protein
MCSEIHNCRKPSHVEFLCGKAPKGKTIVINVMQRCVIAWYKTEGQAKLLMEPVPGIDNGWQ